MKPLLLTVAAATGFDAVSAQFREEPEEMREQMMWRNEAYPKRFAEQFNYSAPVKNPLIKRARAWEFAHDVLVCVAVAIVVAAVLYMGGISPR